MRGQDPEVAKARRAIKRLRRGGSTNPVRRIPGTPRTSQLRWSAYCGRFVVPNRDTQGRLDPAFPNRHWPLGWLLLSSKSHPPFF